jgi:adenylate cyclase
VRVVDGADHCPAPEADERSTLERIEAPPDVRLACQLRPTGDISVEPILTAAGSNASALAPPRPARESEFALLFFDLRLRGGTRGAPVSGHDAIYAFAQYQAIVWAAIESAGGAICSRRADHWLALFGLDSDVREGCRQAIAAARRIEPQATRLRARLSREMGLQTDFTMGVHAGAGVASQIGEGEARTLSAVGEVIDGVAALERLAATRATHFIVSPEAAAAAGLQDTTLNASTSSPSSLPR